MTFDFHCRYGLFTYAQCGSLDPWEVSNHFSTLGGECIIGREEHADGGTHLHAFVDFQSRKRFRIQSFADVCGFHPNIVRSRGTPWDGYDYAIKDGEVVAGGLARPEQRESVLSKNECWSTILDAETRDEFFALVRELAPADLAKCYPSLARYADWQYAVVVPPYSGPSVEDTRFVYDAYPELCRWREGLCESLDGQRGMLLAYYGKRFLLLGGVSPSLGSPRDPRGRFPGVASSAPTLSPLAGPHVDPGLIQSRQKPCPLGTFPSWQDSLGKIPWNTPLLRWTFQWRSGSC